MVIITLSKRYIAIASSALLFSSSYSLKRSLSLPKIITSTAFLEHCAPFSHPETPERIGNTIPVLQCLEAEKMIELAEPTAIKDTEAFHKATSIIESVHDKEYVKSVKIACSRGQRLLSPWDEDTYINRRSFDTAVYAQSAWIEAVDAVLGDNSNNSSNHNNNNSNNNSKPSRMSFAITRPPGHHATYDESMGFCLFNFAVGAAHYALTHYRLENIAILDFDVHYGNGVADLVKHNPRIRYASLHQADIFPYGRGLETETGDFENIYNAPLPMGAKGDIFLQTIEEKLIPFLKYGRNHHDSAAATTTATATTLPQLLIVCAGYDALASDELAQLNLRPEDYGKIARLLRQHFGDSIVFGLEGGYSLTDLPKAIKETILPFVPE